MNCPACGHDTREGARFCDACGTPLHLQCPACGHDLRPGACSCDTCGTALTSPSSSPQQPPETRTPVSYTPRHLAERILTEGRALRGERKEVTVLFVDVQGSTDLANTLDPEVFHRVMDGAFQIMLDAVHHWEGTVNQFTGDGIMALFGAPIAHEDHAQRALHAALEIQRGMQHYAIALRQEQGVSFQVRLGLNSGLVVVGAIGNDLRMDYTAQGLTTNLAARMQQAADPGGILVAAPTYRLGEGYFRFRALGPIHVRGLPEPIDAYVLEGEGTIVSRLEASLRRGVSPFRGREAELRQLGEVWERVVQGRGETICLVGEPGIGKSRLAYEFRQRLAHAERFEGAALSHAQSTAYFVFRQLLRQLAGVRPEADLAEIRDQLHRHLWDLSPALTEHTPEILSILGPLYDASSQPATASEDQQDRLRQAIIAWIKAACQQTAKLILIEDLQWLDPSSESLLHHLTIEAQTVPLMLLMTSRRVLAETQLERHHVQVISLLALSTEDIRALVDAQVDPYPASERLRHLVASHAEGNPFFVEELVRALREMDNLELNQGTYDLREAVEGVVPATINALIASRIDRLPVSARTLITYAAVLGSKFPLTHLRALVADDQIEDDLALLERRGFLDRRFDGPLSNLAFRHLLTQEIAYSAMLQPDRQSRHHQAADMFERLYHGRTETVCEQLARHWGRSDQPTRALPYLLTAADGAVAMGAHREAIGHLQAALDLVTSHPDIASTEQSTAIRLKLAGLYFMVGER